MDDGSNEAPRTNFWQELGEAAPQLAANSIRLLLRPGDATAALQGGWRLIAETSLVQHRRRCKTTPRYTT